MQDIHRRLGPKQTLVPWLSVPSGSWGVKGLEVEAVRRTGPTYYECTVYTPMSALFRMEERMNLLFYTLVNLHPGCIVYTVQCTVVLSSKSFSSSWPLEALRTKIPQTGVYLVPGT